MSDPTIRRTDEADVETNAVVQKHCNAAGGRTDAEAESLGLTATALAARLGISRAHVWKLLSLGRLPAPVRLGRAVRWDRRVIDAWMTAGAPSAAEWERLKQTEKES